MKFTKSFSRVNGSRKGVPIRRDKRFIGRSVEVINPKSIHFGYRGVIKGFRGDQRKGNPYVMVLIYGKNGKPYQIETIPADRLNLLEGGSDI